MLSGYVLTFVWLIRLNSLTDDLTHSDLLEDEQPVNSYTLDVGSFRNRIEPVSQNARVVRVCRWSNLKLKVDCLAPLKFR
ncbi:hypothetical protein CSKR_203007 [Clonorchis sinensis]|uniref:Uncharacterized protein n=1 Tax=Clonorchis sinensis TaxID=79923 RepID=A0A8T1M643_CLOSI|nr:hypothetical protein CSKR_203007 [Clonorchis sinensis]